MVTFTALDPQWKQGEWLNFKDEGPIKPKKPTRKYTVYDKRNGAMLGYIKWDCPWRQYVFFPLNCRLAAKMHEELAAFLRDATTVQRASRGK